MAYIETDHGTIWDNPIPAPTHKTSGIDAIACRRLFLPNEPYIIDELKANINNMDYEVAGASISLDDTATALGISVTYRQFMRTCFNAFDEATKQGGVNVNDALCLPSLYVFELLGILAVGRKEVIIQGVPL